jgi:transcriptional regulator GlxA family with amidase domain
MSLKGAGRTGHSGVADRRACVAVVNGVWWMIIGMPVYDDVDLLDVTGPHEMLHWMNELQIDVDIRLIAERAGPIKTRDGFRFLAGYGFADAGQLDVLWVPGGDPVALAKLMAGQDRCYLDFLVEQSKAAQIVASVCEGALLLAAAGLLDGYRATTHWAFIECLRRFKKVKVARGHPRFVVDGNRLTGGGISSGLDEALALIEILAGAKVAKSIQRTTQYYPKPPVRSALPRKAVDCPFSW